MTHDDHEDCDRQLCEAEDEIIKLKKRIKKLEDTFKVVYDLINNKSYVSKRKIFNWLDKALSRS